MELLIRLQVTEHDKPNAKTLNHNQLISDAQLKWCRDPYTTFQFQIDRMAKALWEKLKEEGVV